MAKIIKMYARTAPGKTQINLNQSYVGERLEEKIERIMSNQEPISDAVEEIYTERKEGVKPEYDIRTDKWDQLIDLKSYIDKSEYLQRENRIKEREDAKKTPVIKMENPGTGADTSDSQK